MANAATSTRTKPKQRGAASREKILETAAAMMADQGYAATPIGEICSRTGLPPTSIYWHFGSKEGLLAAVLEQAAHKWIAELEQAVPAAGVGPDQAFATLAASIRNKPQVLRLMLFMGLDRSHADPAVRETVQGVRDHARRLMAERIAALLPLDGFDAPETVCARFADFVLVLLDGILLAQEIDGDDARVDGLVSMVRTSLAAAGLAELTRAATDKGQP